MKTSELTGAALDWAVKQIEDGRTDGIRNYSPSTNWAQGGPIIEREKLSVTIQQANPSVWFASCPRYVHKQYGSTPLVAAMRCYVASKLGDEVVLPEELK